MPVNSQLGNREKEQINTLREIHNKKQTEQLAKLMEETRINSKAYKALKKELEQMDRTDTEYLSIKSQVDELKKTAIGSKEAQKRFIEQLRESNQESIIKAAEELDKEREIYSELSKDTEDLLEKRKDLIRTKDKLERQLLKAEDKNDQKSIDELNAKIKETEEEIQSAENSLKETLPEGITRGEEKEDKEKGVASAFRSSFMQQAIGAVEHDQKSISGELLNNISKTIGNPLGKVINITGKILDVAMATRKSIDSWVDEAAAVLANNVGKINAALEGTGQTYQSATENMVESLGLSRFVKQTDYISQIATLTSRGITYNVEQRALLETIKDKTVASFSSMDANLLRLVRLKQQDLTASQFGLEAALRNTLNRVFKDSTYLQDMYDSISGAITDAVIISGAKDVTEYSSVIQTWMGAMYESGVDSSTVSKLANALNYLGSGNVSALASDQDIQRLVLLSMDTIGMDYADILQQGLSTSDINNLLNAIVEYLNKIESNTKDNNVLTSSYTQLFGMSMSDLQAFKNLKSKTGQLQAVNMGTALSVVNNELAALQSTERTLVNEQIENAFDNAKFTFGSSIAKDASSYMTWKISNLMLDVVNQVMNAPIGKSPLKTAIKAVGIVTEASIFSQELKGILSIAKALPSLFKEENGGLQTLINGAPSYGDSTSISATISSTGSNFKSVNTMSRIQSNQQYQQEYASYSGEAWEKEEEESDPVLEKLESLCSTLTENEAGKKAFAVFLAGMTNEALNSFASIFADEDAMANTFSGENNVLKDNLYKYGEDTSSNSTEASTKTK